MMYRPVTTGQAIMLPAEVGRIHVPGEHIFLADVADDMKRELPMYCRVLRVVHCHQVNPGSRRVAEVWAEEDTSFDTAGSPRGFFTGKSDDEQADKGQERP
ncbi:MAG TPA: hypothetical protein VGG39_28635 [Polyangiaceae bacterium]